MFSTGKYSHVVKCVALGMLLFYGVASGRAIVPELCNTLSAFSTDKRAVTLSSHSACCEVPGEASAKPCALCTLLCSLSEPFVYTASALLPEVYDVHNEQEPSVYRAQHSWTPASLRGPPNVT